MKRNLNLKFKKGERGKKVLQLRKTSAVIISRLAVHIICTAWMLLVGKKKQKSRTYDRNRWIKKKSKKFSVWVKVTYITVPFVTTEAIIPIGNPFKIESKTLIWRSSYFIHDIIISFIDIGSGSGLVPSGNKQLVTSHYLSQRWSR